MTRIGTVLLSSYRTPICHAMLTALAILALASHTSQATTIDFSEFSPGDVVTGSVTEGVTLGVSGQGTTGGNPRDLMIFDAACDGGPASNCSGGDDDLFQPQFGNVLIISEDNDASDPDDSGDGGVISFDFDVNAFLEEINILDAEEGGELTLFLAAGGLSMTPFTGTDGGVNTLALNNLEVTRLEVSLNGSGAVGDLTFTPVPEPTSLVGMLFAGCLGSWLVRRKRAMS